MMALRMIAAVGLLCLCFDSTTVAGSYCADSDCGSGAMVEVWCSEGEDLCKTTDCGANGVWCPSETDSTAVAGSYCADFDCEDGSANVWCDESEERCNSLECSNGVWCPSETAATDAPEITTATPAATEAPDTATITVQGYLVDNFCVEAGEALDNQAVINTEPEKHTTFCCLMDICVNSGFAILTNDGTADAPDWVVAYQLDDASDDTAKALLEDTDKVDNLMVDATGVLTDNELTLTTLVFTSEEADTLDDATITVQGYLVDNFCVDAGKALDNQAVINTEPELHTAFCCLMDICVDSGFAILTNDGTADAPDWVVAYQLDDASDDTAKALLEDTDKVDNLMVDATGVLTDNELTLTTLVFTSEEADTLDDGTEEDSMAARHSASHFVAATAVVVAAFAL